MTSKSDEQKALNKIVEILEGIDSDGYVNTAFKNCAQYAQVNIDNDWLCSPADNAATYEGQIEDLRRDCGTLKAELNGEKETVAMLRASLQEARRDANGTAEELFAVRQELKAEKETTAKLQQEIIVLKAKLYDLITK